MCSDGKHPPEEWGHLTFVTFTTDDEGIWLAHIEADAQPDRNYRCIDGVWVDQEGVEVSNPVGVKWLDNRCFAEA